MKISSPGLFDESPALLTSERQDRALCEVRNWIQSYCHRRGKTVTAFFGNAVRQAIDEVIDGPRTGRWSIFDLEKTEQTYIGTKMEIVIRSALGLERRKPLDFEIEQHPVDVKWSRTSKWQFPREIVGHLALVIGTNSRGLLFMSA